jgi:membrane glycosyltransferase
MNRTLSFDAAPPAAAAWADTAPPITRASMKPRPWLGFTRGLAYALWHLLWPARAQRAPWGPGVARPAPAPWQLAASRRRSTLLIAVVLLSGSGTVLLLNTGATPLEAWPRALQVGLFALLFAWVSASFVTALMGAWVLWRGDRHALAAPSPYTPIDAMARTAIVMPICNEDIATVFGGLRATCESLAATGALRLFDFYILSDTTDPALRRAEVEAWERLRVMLGDEAPPGGRIFYRLRRRRTRRKAGNIADFCRRWGRNYRYMVVLDADSVMSGATLVSLVRTMEAHPRAGIVQTLPMACGHDTLHARAQAFAARVTGRLFALGLAYWQLGESHYWGHNAIIRLQPFMQHCALAPLPGHGGLAGDIMSHDFVEAALMRRAGFEVWLMPSLGGSWEQHPPNLLDELQRDRRWCQGNLQNARLIAEPGWQPVHRVMFGTAAMAYLVAPLWLAFVVTGVQAALASEGAWLFGADDAPAQWLGRLTGGLWALTLTLLLLPRLLGVLAVLLRGEQRSFGGVSRLFAGSLIELLLSTLQAPVRMVAHTLFVLGALTGLRLDWRSPSRDASAVLWRDALARVGLYAVPALAAGVLAMHGEGFTAALLAPLLLPLALAVPLVVFTGREAAGLALRRRGLLLVPEEHRPPRTLLRSHAASGTRLRAPVPARRRPAAPLRSLLPRPLAGFAATCAMLFATLVPHPLATPPEPPTLSEWPWASSIMDTRHLMPQVKQSLPSHKTALRDGSRRKRQTPVVESNYQTTAPLRD